MKKITNITKIDNKVVNEETFNIFTYKELNEDAKRKAIDDFRGYVEKYKEKLFRLSKEYHIGNICDFKYLQYSSNCCQDDGLSFTAKNIVRPENLKTKKELNPFEKYILEKLNQTQLNELIEDLENNYLDFWFERTSYHHIHSDIFNIYYNIKTESHFKKGFIGFLSTGLFETFYYDICGELEKDGFEIVYARNNTVEECILDIDFNDGIRYFKEDGTFYGILDSEE